MGMIINQAYMDDEVIKPIMKRFDELEKRCDELEKLIKMNDKSTKLKISWMSDNIAKLQKRKK